MNRDPLGPPADVIAVREVTASPAWERIRLASEGF